jgi:hypothetical protein
VIASLRYFESEGIAMTQAYELTAFWDARDRSAEQYAEDLLQLVRALGTTDPRLARWYIDGEPDDVAVSTVEQIKDALLRHPDTWKHGGVTYRAWAIRLGNDSPEGGRVTIDTLVGVDRASSTVWFPNRIGIRFWGPGAQDAFDDPRMVVSWLDTMVAVLEPDWACVCPEGYLKTAWEELLDGRPVVSWMLYLAPEYGAVHPMPPPSTVRSLRDGNLVVTAREWFDPHSATHQTAAANARKTLEAQGKLRMRVTLVPD